MNPPPVQPPGPAPQDLEAGVCEIGARLADFLRAVPGSIGAVITDDVGDTVDFAYHREQVSLLDVELAGAQVSHAIERLRGISVIFGLGDPAILLEGVNAGLIVQVIDASCNLAIMLAPTANLAQVWRRLPDLVRDLERLL